MYAVSIAEMLWLISVTAFSRAVTSSLIAPVFAFTWVSKAIAAPVREVAFLRYSVPLKAKSPTLCCKVEILVLLASMFASAIFAPLTTSAMVYVFPSTLTAKSVTLPNSSTSIFCVLVFKPSIALALVETSATTSVNVVSPTKKLSATTLPLKTVLLLVVPLSLSTIF